MCGPKLTCVECDDRCPWIFVWVVVVEINSVFGRRPQIIWFQCEHLNSLGVSLGGRY